MYNNGNNSGYNTVVDHFWSSVSSYASAQTEGSDSYGGHTGSSSKSFNCHGHCAQNCENCVLSGAGSKY